MNYERIRTLYTLKSQKPSDTEIDVANKKYREECDGLYNNGYLGDFGCGLEFVMSAYSPICWRQFFGQGE